MTADLTHYLYQALEQPIGICLRTSDIESALSRLTKHRDEAQDESLMVLRVIKSRHYPSHELWIVRRRPELPALVAPSS